MAFLWVVLFPIALVLVVGALLAFMMGGGA
jgi:hypothetical protein